MLFKFYAEMCSVEQLPCLDIVLHSYFDKELVPECKSMCCFLFAMKSRISEVVKFMDSVTFVSKFEII